MSLQTPLGRARGMGSAKEGVRHWIQQRVTAVALVPLTIWFVVSVIAHVGANHQAMKLWLGSPVNAALMICLLAAVFHHAQLGLQVVLEDYLSNKAIRAFSVAAVKMLVLFTGVLAVVFVLYIAIGN